MIIININTIVVVIIISFFVFPQVITNARLYTDPMVGRFQCTLHIKNEREREREREREITMGQ